LFERVQSYHFKSPQHLGLKFISPLIIHHSLFLLTHICHSIQSNFFKACQIKKTNQKCTSSTSSSPLAALSRQCARSYLHHLLHHPISRPLTQNLLEYQSSTTQLTHIIIMVATTLLNDTIARTVRPAGARWTIIHTKKRPDH